SVIDATINQQRKRSRGKIEKVSLVGARSSGHIKLAQTLKKSSSRQDLTQHEFLPVSNIKNPACGPGDASSFQQKTNKEVTPDSKFVSPTLMSCLRCYMHVLVRETDPKCPKCGKGDCLLDMFH
nr:protein phosphatase 2C family protein [Tanacetum cinerariifolium]